MEGRLERAQHEKAQQDGKRERWQWGLGDYTRHSSVHKPRTSLFLLTAPINNHNTSPCMDSRNEYTAQPHLFPRATSHLPRPLYPNPTPRVRYQQAPNQPHAAQHNHTFLPPQDPSNPPSPHPLLPYPRPRPFSLSQRGAPQKLNNSILFLSLSRSLPPLPSRLLNCPYTLPTPHYLPHPSITHALTTQTA